MQTYVTTRGTKTLIGKLEGMGELAAFMGRTRGHVGSNLYYAGFVNDGTKPHVITARNAQALYWSGATHPVNSVNHPGYKGSHFLEKAEQRAREEVVNVIWLGFQERSNDTRKESRLVLLGALEVLLKAAKEEANKKSGRLRDSLHVEVL